MIAPDTTNLPGAAGASSAQAGADGFSVPVKAITIDGVPPTAGDEVEFSVKGRVASVTDESAAITVAEINGLPFSAPRPQEDPDDAVRRLASEADANLN